MSVGAARRESVRAAIYHWHGLAGLAWGVGTVHTFQVNFPRTGQVNIYILLVVLQVGAVSCTHNVRIRAQRLQFSKVDAHTRGGSGMLRGRVGPLEGSQMPFWLAAASIYRMARWYLAPKPLVSHVRFPTPYARAKQL